MATVDGIRLPGAVPGVESWEEKIGQLRQLTLRDDDVFLLAYPKSGTHWQWEVVNMLRKGRAEHDMLASVQFMMEFVQVDTLNDMPSPRTFTTHLPFSMLPVGEIKHRRLKLIHVYRNPKDTCVSMFNMARSSKRMMEFTPANNFEEFVDYYFSSDKVIFGSYFNYLQQMHRFQQQNPDLPYCNLAFEEIKKDPVSCVKTLAAFLGLSVSDELCSDIAEACSLENMKKHDSEKARIQFVKEKTSKTEEQEEYMIKHLPSFFRKGEVGDWKNYFTVATNERVDQIIRREMKDLPFNLIFE